MTMKRITRASGIAAMVLAAVVAMPRTSVAQEPPGAAKRGTPPGGRGARVGLPPLSPKMDAQQLQAYLDAFALVQAERELGLSADQYAAFVTRLTRLQNLRRRALLERRRLLGELRSQLDAPNPREEAIGGVLEQLDDLARRSAADVARSYQEIDAVLTPWQRGRFRLFEEQLDRRKVELLAKISGEARPPDR